MRNAAIGAIAAGVLLIFAVKMAFPSYESIAKTRVTNVLNGMKEGTGTNSKLETAMAMWAMNKVRITDNLALSASSDGFDKWRMAKDLYRPTGDFKIDKVEKVNDPDEPTAIVSFTLEGKPYKVLVPRDHPIKWAE
jgi:hypothetical protein